MVSAYNPWNLVAKVGIGLVGVSSILAGEGSQTVKVSTADMIMGMGLIVASQVPANFNDTHYATIQKL